VISRGKHGEYLLYEVTEQDLLLKSEAVAAYRVGNVLIFADRKSIGFGNELARADDIFAAKEYLETSSPQATALTRRFESELEALREKIDQRDELLRDLADNLRIQKVENELLLQRLQESQELIATAELSRSEMVDDLHQVSAETQMMEANLQRTFDEKAQLEQELASRLTEIVELNLLNSELSRQIQHADAAGDVGLLAPGSLAAAPEAADGAQVLTMTSGRQVHLYHEFPYTARSGLPGRLSGGVRSVLRIVLVAAAAVAVLLATSVLATAAANQVSLGEALDVLVGSLNEIWPQQA
jgi:hypothetical protein